MPQKALHPLSSNIHLLGGVLGETICRFEGKRIFRKVENLRQLAQKARVGLPAAQRLIERELKSLSHADKYKVAKAFTEFLRLANLCEQVHRIRRRTEHRRDGAAAQRASPLDTFERLLKSGRTPQAVRKALSDIRIELVLTAHPTEAELPRSIRIYRDLAACLLKLDDPDLAESDRTSALRDIDAFIARLWLSGETRAQKPTPVEEARYGLELAERILWRTVPEFHAQMGAAYRQAIGDMSALYPRPIRFSSWMGGDRDGHPGVTARVTREVLDETSKAAVARYRAAVADLRDALVFDGDARGLKLRKNCNERLDAIGRGLDTVGRPVKGPGKRTVFTRNEFLRHLYGLQKFLQDCGAEVLVRRPLQELIWRVHAFGLCFLKLDIRQSADVHEAAVDELLRGRYAPLSEPQKIRVLSSALRGKTRVPRRLSRRTAEVLETLRLYKDVQPDFLGPYVISMASKASDLLGVMFLMKAAGVRAPVPICPLFETPDSLLNAHAVMEKLYGMPAYKRHTGGLQQIMLGYSDSAKRGGYLHSAWEIHKLQSKLTALGEKNGISTVFFHGRGGSVARGGGPIETALLALPRPHLSRTIRVTEQGEAINAKFGLPEVAQRTMELYLSGFLEAVLSRPQKPTAAWVKTMDRLVQRSSGVFRAAVYENPDFMKHFLQLTPTAELDILNIGSRPARRKKGGGLDSLRAIPWVFGWTQSRTLLPAWLGLAEALDAEIKAGNVETLRDMYRNWPFFRSAIDLVEMVVAKADARVTTYYSDRLVDPALRHLTKDYLARLKATEEALLTVTRRRRLLETAPVLSRSIRLRSPYVDVLNILQAHLLEEYRALPRAPEALRRTLALTISGISAGMRNTG